MKCRITVLSYLLDVMDSIHILSELLKRVTPEENVETDLSASGQQDAIADLLRNANGFQDILEEFRFSATNLAEDSPADKADFERVVKEIKEAMIDELDNAGYLTGRALDRRALPDANQEAKGKQLSKRQKQLTKMARAKAKAAAKGKRVRPERNITLDL